VRILFRIKCKLQVPPSDHPQKNLEKKTTPSARPWKLRGNGGEPITAKKTVRPRILIGSAFISGKGEAYHLSQRGGGTEEGKYASSRWGTRGLYPPSG